MRIEYSRRDDIFRVWYVHEQNAELKIGIINIPRIVRVEELVDERFDLKEQRKILDKLYDETMTSIQIEFYQGIKNLPDRILTEFSLWKKKCVYDPLSYKFTMTLYYSAVDEKEILIRLLSYTVYSGYCVWRIIIFCQRSKIVLKNKEKSSETENLK